MIESSPSDRSTPSLLSSTMPAPASEDDLKRRARRRLIGAVALTLAAVILLPLLLEDEPPPAGRLEVNMPPVAVSPKQVEEEPAMPTVAQAEAPRVEPPRVEPSMAPPPQAPLAAKPEPKPKVLVQPVAKRPPEPNAPPKTESKLTASLKAAPSAFVVQLGAFSDTAKMTALRSRAEELGLPLYTDKSGALTRLRVGPFSSREAAVDAAVKLAEIGMNGQVMPK